MQPISNILNLNTTCQHYLNDFYSVVKEGKNTMVDMQLSSGGKAPFVKIAISSADQPRMQLIAPDQWLSMKSQDVSNLFSYYWGSEEITVEATAASLKLARESLEAEIPKKYQEWTGIKHEESDRKNLLESIESLRQDLLTVNYVVSVVSETYKDKDTISKDVDPIEKEHKLLSDFIENTLEKEIKELQEDLLPKTLSKNPSPTTNQSELHFNTHEDANKWYMRVLPHYQSLVKNAPTQTVNFKDLKSKFIFKKFSDFATEIDNKLGLQKAEFYSKKIGLELCEKSASIELRGLLGEPKSFAFLMNAIAIKGSEEDFQLMFDALLNKEKNGPFDLDKAPIILQKLMMSIAYFKLFKNLD